MIELFLILLMRVLGVMGESGVADLVGFSEARPQFVGLAGDFDGQLMILDLLKKLQRT